MRKKKEAEALPVVDASFPRWMLPAIVAVYCVLALWLIVTVPLGKAPDETAHIEYVQHLANVGSFPVFKPLGAKFPGYEFHQPPLYYVACVPFWKLTGPGVQNYACRFVSMLFGAGTLVLLWGSIRRLFPANRELPILATGFAALLPLHVAVGASGGNDTAAGFFCAAMLWCLARGVDGWDWRGSALLGACIGLGMLSKSTALGVAIPAVAGAAWLARTHAPEAAMRARAILLTLALTTGVAVMVCGWWLARNVALYGDPFAARIFDEAFQNSSPRPSFFFETLGATLGTYLRALLLVMFTTTWGFFGGPNTALEVLNPFGRSGPRPEVIPAMLPMLICAIATVAALAGLLRWLRSEPQNLRPGRRIAAFWWGGALLAVLLVWARFNLMQFQGQARYIHPALLPIALFAALGWWQLFFNGGRASRRGWMVSGGFAVLLVALTLWNAFGWRTLV